MKKAIRQLVLTMLACGMGSHAAVISNYLSDAGFEVLDGSSPAYEPNAGTAPWYTSGENAAGSFKATATQAKSGSQSAVFDWYGDAGAFVQNADATVDVSATYEVSMWMLTAEPSGTGSHVNDPILNIGLYTSTNNGVSYQFAETLYSGALNSTTNVWEQFTAVVDGAALVAYAGQKVQLRFNKSNATSTHQIFIDDVVFGEKAAEPPPPNQMSDPGFDSISGNEPNAGTAPWATAQENQSGSFITGTDRYRSETQSAKFTFYFDNGSIVQNLTNQIDTAKNYAASVWMLTDEQSGDTSHTNPPSLAIELYASPTLGSSYTYAGTFSSGNLNSGYNVWQQFSGMVSGASLAGRNGEFIQIRFKKEYANASHRMWIDDASLSNSDHVPATYYLDAVSGSDWNNGLSTATAWQTMDRLNSKAFGAGDKILFKRGQTFTGGFTLNGSGTATEPLIIAAYGPGNKPVLSGGTNNEAVIFFEGSRGFEIRNLMIRNNHPTGSLDDRFGIVLEPSVNAGDLQHIHFVNIDFVDIAGSGSDHESRGIIANTDGTDNADILSRWNDLLIEHCHFENIDGRGAQVRDNCNNITDQLIRGYDYYPSVGVVFQYNTGKDCYRNLFQINGTSNAVIQYNTHDGTQEGSAFWPFSCEGTLVQFNIFKNIYKAGADASVCHFDFNCVDSLMQYNVGINVNGSLIQVLNNSNGSNFQINAVARYNLGIDCGWRNNNNSAGIMITGDSTGSKIYNNTLIFTDLHPAYKALSFANWGGAWPTNSLIANNIFFAAGSAATYANQDKMNIRDNVVTHNLYTGNVAVCSADVSPVFGNPLFVDASGASADDFKVRYASDAIGLGTVIANNGGLDYFGNPLTTTAPTVGFHEYQTDAVIDSEGDLMPDLWEMSYGLLPDMDDAALDGDNDDRSNLDEYAANTHPGDGQSYFIAQVLLATQELGWDEQPERLYHVFQALDLQDAWSLKESNAVPPVSIDISGNEGFYKVEVEYAIP